MKRAITLHLLCLSLLIFSGGILTSQVTADGNGAGIIQEANINSITLGSFMVPSGNDALLVVFATQSNSRTVTGITYNGSNLIFLGTSALVSGNISEIWYLALGNVAVGGITSNVVVSLSGTAFGRGVIAASYKNVDQTTPMNNFNSVITNSLNINSANNNMVVSSTSEFFSLAGGLSANGGETEEANISSPGNRDFAASRELSSGASVNMSWSIPSQVLLNGGNIKEASLSSFAPNALSFDGTNDQVLVTDHPTLDMGTSDFTLEAWVKKDVAAGGHIISKRGAALSPGFQFFTNPDGTVGATLLTSSTATAQSSGSINGGAWHHVAATFDRDGNLTIYIDGSADGTGNISSLSADISNPNNLGIGFRGDAFGWLIATIDEVRIWNVLRTAGEISGNMNTELACNTAGLVACYHFNQGIAGGDNTGGPTTLTDGTANANNGTLTNFALTGATSNWVASSIVLPVEMVSFDARLLGTSILLTWQTATETNNRGWDIEHSTNAKDWKWVGFSGGRGESFELQSYTYTHKRPTPGTNYYRLKQIDYDGKSEYSDIVSVQFAVGSPQLEVFPNPVLNGELTLYLPETNDDKAIIRLYDQMGRLALQQTTSSQHQTLNVSQLSAGIYFVEVTVSGKVFREKVVVE